MNSWCCLGGAVHVRELREELSRAEHKQTELQRGIVILAAVHGELQDSQGAVADCTEALKLDMVLDQIYIKQSNHTGCHSILGEYCM